MSKPRKGLPDGLRSSMQKSIAEMRGGGLYKEEREILGPQGPNILVSAAGMSDGRGRKPQELVNFCANNYLGLANHPEVIGAAKQGLDTHGYGTASVRFICGTQDLHAKLERNISSFLGFEGTILHSSCFDANGGLFEAVLSEADMVISDRLNHASIIDGIRLCKAQRAVYQHMDMEDLARQLREARGKAKNILIATDGVFSMDGEIAPLREICALAQEAGAAVMVDDSHATGFFGPGGRGTPAHCGAEGSVAFLTSTLGKALGGASGGFVSSEESAIELLRQKSRPYLFSNALAPPIAAASLRALELIQGKEGDRLREDLMRNTRHFRKGIVQLGFAVRGTEHPIVPVMLRDEKLALRMADLLCNEGIYVRGFAYPVVPRGEARLRVQLSAAHTAQQVGRCLDAFEMAGKALNVI